MGQWVMGQMGHHFWMGNMTMKFLFVNGLYCICCVSQIICYQYQATYFRFSLRLPATTGHYLAYFVRS